MTAEGGEAMTTGDAPPSSLSVAGQLAKLRAGGGAARAINVITSASVPRVVVVCVCARWCFERARPSVCAHACGIIQL